MIEAAECVVIGSEALGASVAFHLAGGRKQVALVDKHALGSQTSPRAAGLTSQARGTDLMTTLAQRAGRKIETFERDTGETLHLCQPGPLKVARTPEHVVQLRSELERSRRLGIALQAISPSEARATNPLLETAGILAVNLSPTPISIWSRARGVDRRRDTADGPFAAGAGGRGRDR